MSRRFPDEPGRQLGKQPAIGLRIDAKSRDLGDGATVRRTLPDVRRRAVGPFVFIDHFGPRSRAVDVPPHPHIGLATVTWLFEGRVIHRDSTGVEQVIEPGAVNWMHAGRAIVHSERDGGAARTHGLQLWVGLPKAEEDTAPAFEHTPAERLPVVEASGVRLRVVAGEGFGARSPVSVRSRLGYVVGELRAGARLVVPGDLWRERALQVVSGDVWTDGEPHPVDQLAVLEEGVEGVVEARSDALVALVGGDPLDGPRHMNWNFVHSDRAAIARARDDWRNRRFPVVPGDEDDFVPLPG